MEKFDTGSVIYSISIGENPNNGIKWYVGQRIRIKKKSDKTEYEATISHIVFDEPHYFHYKIARYAIIVREENGNEMLWKTVSNRNLYIAYDI